jgi:outer membrane protein TolC
VDEAKARRAVAREALAAAEKALVILEDRFAQGVARTTDLLDAETEAHEARVRDTEAHYDVMRALGTLRFAIGEAPVPEVDG